MQEHQPVEALLLVVPERGLEPGRRAHRLRRGEPLHPGDALGPPLGLLPDDAELGQLVPPAGLEAADAGHAVAGGVCEAAGLVDELAEPRELGAVESQPGARREDERGVAPVERGEQADEVDRLTVDAHLDVEVEPVGALTVVALGDRERDARVVGGLAQLGLVAGELDGEAAPRLQPGDHLGEQGHDGGARHGEVVRPSVRTDEAGQQVGRQAEALDRGRLRAAVPAAPTGVAEGVVDGPLAAAVARRPAEHRGVERGALDEEDQAVEPAGGERDAAVRGADLCMAGELGLVHVEELVDVAGGDGDRVGGDQPGDRRVQRCGEGDEPQPAGVGQPEAVGRGADETDAVVVDGQPLAVEGEPRREGHVAGRVRGQVDVGPRRGGRHLDGLLRPLADQHHTGLDRPLELVPEVGAELGEGHGLHVGVVVGDPAAGHERPERGALPGLGVGERGAVGGADVPPRGAGLDPLAGLALPQGADRDARAGDRPVPAGRRALHRDLEGQAGGAGIAVVAVAPVARSARARRQLAPRPGRVVVGGRAAWRRAVIRAATQCLHPSPTGQVHVSSTVTASGRPLHRTHRM